MKFPIASVGRFRKTPIVALFAVLLLLGAIHGPPLHAQGLQVEKIPGEPVILTWDFDPANEAYITGFLVQSGPDLMGPWADLQTIAANLRQATFPAAAVPTFYQAVAYKDVTGNPRLYSDASNPVGVTLKIPLPFGLRTK